MTRPSPTTTTDHYSMNNHKALTNMSDLQLEAIAGDETHSLNEMATEVLEERVSSASEYVRALGFNGNLDFFSVRTA